MARFGAWALSLGGYHSTDPRGSVLNSVRRFSVQGIMEVSDLCKNGLRIQLMQESGAHYLRISLENEPGDPSDGKMPCDPDVLCAVLRGLTYQLTSKHSFCVIRRVDGHIAFEYELAGVQGRCIMTTQDFSKLVAPVMPARLRAMLL